MRAKLFKNSNISKVFLSGILILLSLIFATPQANATITKELNYQGRLTNLSDINVPDTSYSIVFRIYDSASGGNCLWSARGTCGSPTARSVSTSGGIFSIALGDTVAGDNAISLDFNSTYYLSVKIGADSEMSPRKKISASGYAFNSDLLDGLNSATYGADAHVLATDASGNLTVSGNVGIGTTTPGATLAIESSTALSGDPALDDGGIGFGNNGIIFEGATANTFENYLTLADPATADRTWTLPNVTGAIVTTGDSGTITSAMVGTDLDFADFDNTLDLDANLTLNQATYTATQNFTGTTTTGLTYNANSLTTGTGLTIASTSTAGGASGNSYLLNLARSGANSNATHSAYGIYSNVTNTGTTSTNVAGYFSASGATNNYGLIVNAGNVGIGTTSPSAKLSVVSDSPVAPYVGISLKSDNAAGYTAYSIGRTGVDGYWGVAGGTNHYYTGTVVGDTVLAGIGKLHLASGAISATVAMTISGGNVGIGTTGPIAQTEIYGNSQLTAALTDAGVRTGTLAINGGTAGSAGEGGAILFGNISSHSANSVGFAAIKGLLGNGSGNTAGDLAFSTRNAYTDTNLTERMRITSTGNVGIGTTGPQSKLSVDDTNKANSTNGSNLLIRTTDTATIDMGGVIALGGNYNSTTNWAPFGTIRGAKENVTADNYAGYLQFNTIAHGSVFTEKMRITSAGNVGIGTTSPGTKLDVNGVIRGTSFSANGFDATGLSGIHIIGGVYSGNGQILAYNYPSSGYVDLVLGQSATAGMIIQNSGNVGIGTTGPNGKLAVTIGGASGTGSVYTYPSTSASQGILNGYYVFTGAAGGMYTRYLDIAAVGAPDGTYGDSAIRFLTNPVTNASSATEAMRITGSGNVGIGTTGPLTALDLRVPYAKTDTTRRDFLFASNEVAPAGLRFSITGGASQAVREAHIQTTDWGVTNGGNLALQPYGGNVGIGTTSPTFSKGAGLHIYGNTADEGGSTIRLTDGGQSANGNFEIRSTRTGSVNRLEIGEASDTFMTFLSDAGRGNVGIGTTSPGAKLDVYYGAGEYFRSDGHTTVISSGNTTPTAFTVNLTGTANLIADFQDNGTSVLAVQNGGNIGIGTTAPGAKLEIVNTSVGAKTYPLLLTNVGGASVGSGVGINFDSYDAAGATPVGRIENVRDGAGLYSLRFSNFINATGLSETMIISGTGNVGIGTTAPGQKLDVAGTVRMTGISGATQTISNSYGNYQHIGGWGVARTAATAVLVNTAYMSDVLSTARTIWGQSFNGSANISGAITGASTGSFSSTITAPTFSGALSGNATTATRAYGMTTADYLYSTSGQAVAYTSAGGPQVYGQGSGAAMVSLHRPGVYAVNFGLDTDNQLKVGGWSMGAASYKVWHAGNDGSGSGLDADTLDGFNSSAFGDATAANQTTILSRIGTSSDGASMASTLFAGQQAIYDVVSGVKGCISRTSAYYWQYSGSGGGSMTPPSCPSGFTDQGFVDSFKTNYLAGDYNYYHSEVTVNVRWCCK
jgi:hypothetical protein